MYSNSSRCGYTELIDDSSTEIRVDWLNVDRLVNTCASIAATISYDVNRETISEFLIFRRVLKTSEMTVQHNL